MQLIDGKATDFKAVAGNGLKGKLGTNVVAGGNLKFISDYCNVSDDLREKADSLSSEGKTPLFFARNNELLGIIAVADTIKKDSPQAIKELQNMGIRVVMITGDNERSAKAIGKLAGVDEVIAGVLPEGKEKEIARLKEQGSVIRLWMEFLFQDILAVRHSLRQILYIRFSIFYWQSESCLRQEEVPLSVKNLGRGKKKRPWRTSRFSLQSEWRSVYF